MKSEDKDNSYMKALKGLARNLLWNCDVNGGDNLKKLDKGGNDKDNHMCNIWIEFINGSNTCYWYSLFRSFLDGYASVFVIITIVVAVKKESLKFFILFSLMLFIL